MTSLATLICTLTAILCAISATSSAAAATCGKPAFSPLNRIVGGSEATAHSWPWQASILRRYTNWWLPNCGGSLIADQWIMTAAHCALDDNKLPLDASKFRILLGAHNIAQAEISQVQKSVSGVFVHASYAGQDHDIALLKLSSKVALNNYISTVCLPSATAVCPQAAGYTGVVTGWGRIQENGAASSALRQVTMQTYEFASCNTIYGGDLASDEFCVGSGAGGKDSCQGDSGGPFVYKSNNQWYQLGIVSWGNGCARQGYPGVYGCVAKYRSWIDKVMKDN